MKSGTYDDEEGPRRVNIYSHLARSPESLRGDGEWLRKGFHRTHDLGRLWKPYTAAACSVVLQTVELVL